MSLLAPFETVTTRQHDDDGVWHAVCHCTDGNLAACGLDMTNEPWGADDSEPMCPLCGLAWPVGAPTCPWGCACDECACVESDPDG